MDQKVLSLEEIIRIIKPLAEKYHFEEIIFLARMHGEKQQLTVTLISW